jgi:hypothetical protein
MKVKLHKVPHLFSKHSFPITRIWAHDGWCYIPELSKRERFSTTDEPGVIHVETEAWWGVIPKPLHMEALKYSPLSEEPRVWEEQGSSWCERYEETIPNTKMSSHPRLPPRLPLR